jgi:hypothetical protein
MKLLAAEDDTFRVAEYGTIRWAGRENTYFVRPNGKVDSLGPILTKVSRPDRVDERAYFMNVAINAVAREGFEVAALAPDEVLVRRNVQR